MDAAVLKSACAAVARAAGEAHSAAVLGTERVIKRGRHLTALVADDAGRRLGFQDKLQLDPSEEARCAPGRWPRRARL